MSNYGYVSGTGASDESKSFTTTGPSQVKAVIPPGGTAEIKTAVYQADLGDRTEGNQNWGETGGDLQDRTSWSGKAREVGVEASDKARDMGLAAEQSSMGSATQTLKAKAAETGEVLKEKWEQGKEKAAEVWEQGKQKASDTYQVAKEDAAIAKAKVDEKMEAGKERAAEMYDSGKQKAVDTYESGKQKAAETYEAGKMKAADTYESGKQTAADTYVAGQEKTGQLYDSAAQKVEPKEPGLIERVKETVGTATHNVQVKSHEWAESAQNTLEAAREKAREVFVGAQSPKSDVNIVGAGAGKTEVTVKTTPAPGAYTQVDANTESKIQ